MNNFWFLHECIFAKSIVYIFALPHLRHVVSTLSIIASLIPGKHGKLTTLCAADSAFVQFVETLFIFKFA